MNRLTLPEEVMLLSLDDDSGAGKDKESARWALAGGVLVELVTAGRLEVDGKTMTVVDTATTGFAHLDAALAAIAEKGPELKVRAGLDRARRAASDATTRSLVERGLIREETKKVLGLFPVTRYPEADGTAETELRQRLADVVLDGADPDERTAALVALLHGARLHRLVFAKRDRRVVDRRMAEIADGQWVQPAVRRAIDEATAVLTAVVVGAATAGAAGG